jgi:hypothetical protein
VAVVVAPEHADSRPATARAVPLAPSAVILHVEPPRRILVARDLVHALPELGIGFLFSRYATESNRPVQELVEHFSIVP